MADYPNPAHDLQAVQAKVQVGFVSYYYKAIDTAAELDFTRADIDDCLLGLQSADFYKSMDARNPAWCGCRQDVYRPRFFGEWMYVKFQLFPVRAQRVHVVSFKRKVDDDERD